MSFTAKLSSIIDTRKKDTYVKGLKIIYQPKQSENTVTIGKKKKFFYVLYKIQKELI